jgi:hypothetical protein
MRTKLKISLTLADQVGIVLLIALEPEAICRFKSALALDFKNQCLAQDLDGYKSLIRRAYDCPRG